MISNIIVGLFLLHYFLGAAFCFAAWVLPISSTAKFYTFLYLILAIPVFAWLANKYA
ncbi:hypothetical protein APK87_09 [Acinetobacter phage vB_AbaP_APK87]|uniref:Uncharacterized protein n=3 Tax=Friunavirus TaxID=1985711 RepID=A0A221SBU7_9CAUD|nr:hypothetical protein FDI33_gp09 [Acinetobacter phage vB_ApiP_P1]ASN73470.1 hypothetical protein P1_09 [Acinetobacter phage vB_ApiP_P1]QGK90459.1 hypothetical protein APK87_09 [Acinetobacter phage vB_AbaP_APK87]UAW09931.1 hypothetical protein APK86_08 [Acinetobacter phage APK86]